MFKYLGLHNWKKTHFHSTLCLFFGESMDGSCLCMNLMNDAKITIEVILFSRGGHQTLSVT